MSSKTNKNNVGKYGKTPKFRVFSLEIWGPFIVTSQKYHS